MIDEGPLSERIALDRVQVWASRQLLCGCCAVESINLYLGISDAKALTIVEGEFGQRVITYPFWY